MDNYKNIFMFKNPIRHFLNSENFKYPKVNIGPDQLENQNWSTPIDFKVRKYYGENANRVLKIPNLLVFNSLYQQVVAMDKFRDFDNISELSRVKVSLKTGDFKAYSYQKVIEKDLFKLTYYDNLYKFDISSFYSRIYTHELVKYNGFSNVPYNHNDRFITNINKGKTNSIIMGNYISLYLAEFLLKEIMNEIRTKFISSGIFVNLSNFSDDIYVFGFSKDEENINTIISDVLNEYGFQLNDHKTEVFDYRKYNTDNIITKYWKTVISKQKFHIKSIDSVNLIKKTDEQVKYKLNFLNQVIYRATLLNDNKNESIFIKNFFKSNFFIDLNIENYYVTNESMHQLIYLIKQCPEVTLYIIPKFRTSKYFYIVAQKLFEKEVDLMLEDSRKGFHEEQIYFYLGARLLDVDIKEETIEKIMSQDNQILKAYVISDFHSFFDNKFEKYFADSDSQWFINYTIISEYLVEKDYEEAIKKYLVPEKYKNEQINYIVNFYLENCKEGNKLIKQIKEVEKEVLEYLELKKQEREDLAEEFAVDISEIDF